MLFIAGKFNICFRSAIRRKLSFFQNLTPAVHVLNCPGSRVIELSQPAEGNLLSANVINTIAQKFDLMEVNPSIAAVLFMSQSPDLFSNGLHQESTHQGELLKLANDLSLSISKSKKETIAIFEGIVRDSAFGLFGSCKVMFGAFRRLDYIFDMLSPFQYRLGTSTTSFWIDIFKPDSIQRWTCLLFGERVKRRTGGETS